MNINKSKGNKINLTKFKYTIHNNNNKDSN